MGEINIRHIEDSEKHGKKDQIWKDKYGITHNLSFLKLKKLFQVNVFFIIQCCLLHTIKLQRIIYQSAIFYAMAFSK